MYLTLTRLCIRWHGRELYSGWVSINGTEVLQVSLNQLGHSKWCFDSLKQNISFHQNPAPHFWSSTASTHNWKSGQNHSGKFIETKTILDRLKSSEREITEVRRWVPKAELPADDQVFTCWKSKIRCKQLNKLDCCLGLGEQDPLFLELSLFWL